MEIELPVIELYRLRGERHACTYLPDEVASLEYRFFAHLSAAGFGEALRRGWRRNGHLLFRPACPNCCQCRSLRVEAAAFHASKSQRRNRSRNRDVRWEVGRPEISDAHIGLFNRYHADMQARRGWPDRETTAEEYYECFLSGDWDFAREFRFFSGRQLIGVGLVDEVADATSSVYFYHDPDWRPRGLGTYSLLCELEYAVARGLKYVYLGYWIAACPSMAYKARYGPHEILTRYPDDDEEPCWVKAP